MNSSTCANRVDALTATGSESKQAITSIIGQPQLREEVECQITSIPFKTLIENAIEDSGKEREDRNPAEGYIMPGSSELMSSTVSRWESLQPLTSPPYSSA